jgi:hypothetical protein
MNWTTPRRPALRPMSLTTAHRSALLILADCPEGCPEALLLAHGFTVDTLCALVGAGLTTATTVQMIAGGKMIEVTRVKITAAGRHALER